MSCSWPVYLFISPNAALRESAVLLPGIKRGENVNCFKIFEVLVLRGQTG